MSRVTEKKQIPAASRTEHIDVFKMPVLWARDGGGVLVIALCFWLRPPAPYVYWLIGIVDICWGVLHFQLWKPGLSRAR